MESKNHSQHFKACNGFTLVEVLIVTGIVSILALVASPNLLGAKDKAKRAACETHYTLLTPELATQMDNLEGASDKAEKALDQVVQRHNASGGGPFAGGDANPMDRREDAFVDKGNCGSFVPPPSSSCQVFLCFEGSATVVVQQHEAESGRSYRIIH